MCQPLTNIPWRLIFPARKAKPWCRRLPKPPMASWLLWAGSLAKYGGLCIAERAESELIIARLPALAKTARAAEPGYDFGIQGMSGLMGVPVKRMIRATLARKRLAWPWRIFKPGCMLSSPFKPLCWRACALAADGILICRFAGCAGGRAGQSGYELFNGWRRASAHGQ